VENNATITRLTVSSMRRNKYVERDACKQAVAHVILLKALKGIAASLALG
jgi:hypothetical protein